MPFPWNSLGDYIAEHESLGEVVRIKEPIKCGDPNSIVDTGWVGKSRESELRILFRYLQTLPRKPIGIIENPISNRPDVPVVINYWGSTERAMRSIGCASKDDVVKKVVQMVPKQIPPEVLGKSEAPCKDVIIKAEDLDLERDLPRLWVEFENHSWFTFGTSIIRDEETGNHDLGTWRYGFFDWQEGDPSRPHPDDKRKKHVFAVVFWRTARATKGGTHYAKFRKAGKPMPFALAYGCEPSIHAVGSARLPFPEHDELSLAGGFRGKPLQVVESETIPGLMVPAHADWIIEGEFLPEDYQVAQGAEAVWQGYIVGGELCPIARVKCITHRKNPIWPITWSGKIIGDHYYFGQMWYEAEALRILREQEFKVKDVAIYDMAMAVIQSEIDGMNKNDFPYYGKLMASALYGSRSRHASGKTLKCIIVVGPDINPHDPREVFWALNTRTRLISDTIMIPKGLATWGDPSAETGLLGWKVFGEQMLIDGLIKIPEATTWYPPVSEPKDWEREGIETMKKKIKSTY